MSLHFILIALNFNPQLTNLKIRHNPFARGIQGRAQLSITNGEPDYTDDDDDILPPIFNRNPHSSLLTAHMATMPYLPPVPLPSQESSSLPLVPLPSQQSTSLPLVPLPSQQNTSLPLVPLLVNTGEFISMW